MKKEIEQHSSLVKFISSCFNLMVWLFCSFVILGSSFSIGLGQQVTTATTAAGTAVGTPAGSYPLGGFDNINLFNGKMNFQLPLASVGGRGEANYTVNLNIERDWTIERV